MFVSTFTRAVGFLLLAATSVVDGTELTEKHRLVDELMVFIDKEAYSKRLSDYHKRLILPAVKEYYAATTHGSDSKIIDIAEAKIDDVVHQAVFKQGLIEKINREYFSQNLSEQELRAIVEILKLPKGKQILLDFSGYLHEAQALRVTKGRDMSNVIEKEILDVVAEYLGTAPERPD